MSRAKRSSNVLEAARQRLAGLKKISPKPTFAGALSEETYEAESEGYGDEQNAYNGEVAALDERSNRLEARERVLEDLSQRILAGIRSQYGPDSNELELVGGVRRSDRKHPVRPTKLKTA